MNDNRQRVTEIENTDKFTPNQRRAIDTVDQNVLVMASAGSGKTTVMIEKIVQLVIKHNVPVKKLLVVTFVNSVAGDIKEKLFKALREKYKKEPSESLFNQIQDVSIANISTIHGFCNDLIKSYFYKTDVNPDYKIASQEECNLFKEQALTLVTDRYYEAENQEFLDLISIFKVGRTDKKLREGILKIYEFSCAKTEPDKFFEDSVNFYEDENFVNSIFNKFLETEKERVAYLRNQLLNIHEELTLTSLSKQIEDCIQILSDCERIFKATNFEQFVQEIEKTDFPRIPMAGVKNADSISREIYEKFKVVRDSLKKFCDEHKKNNLKESRQQTVLTAKYVKCLCELTKEFKKEYQAVKKDHNVLDFNDMEEKTVQLLSDEDVCNDVKNSFEYVFVDEYQDINAVQEFILSKVSNDRNMFMVGDAKQSIYAFRLCNPQIFLDKYSLYKDNGGGLALEFNKNFRSGKNVLDFCNVIFSSLMNIQTGGVDYKNNAMLEFGGKAVDMPRTVEIINIDIAEKENETADEVYSVKNHDAIEIKNSAYYEAQVIADKIVNLVGKEEIFDDTLKCNRFVRYSDITILMRSMKNNNLKLYKNLQELGIPMQAEIANELSNEIKVLIDFLRIVSNCNSEIPLVSVMRSHIGGFSDNELARIKLDCKEDKLPFYKRAKNYIENNKESLLGEKLKKFFDMIEEFSRKSSFKTVGELLVEIIKRTNYDSYVMTLKNGESRNVKLNNFIIFVNANSSGTSLAKFLKNVSEIEKSIKVPSNLQTNTDAVTLMTVHKSKGLEFPIVIFAGTGNRFNKTSDATINFSDEFGIGLDCYDFDKMTQCPTLNSILIKKENLKNDMFEELRVLYVCLTRAKNKLIITGISPKKLEVSDINAETLVKASCFLQLINYATDNGNKSLLEEIGVSQSVVSSVAIDQINKSEEKEAYLPKYNFDEGLNLLKQIQKPYPHLSATQIPQKLTVTEINENGEDRTVFEVQYNNESDEIQNKDNFIWEIGTDLGDHLKSENLQNDLNLAEKETQTKNLNSKSNEKSEERILRGVCHHKILELLDLNDPTMENIEKVIIELHNSGVLSSKHLGVLDKQSIFKVANSEFIKECVKNKVYRELPFLMKIPANEILPTDCTDFVMVQGQIDMLVVAEDRAIVVDFKYTSLRDESIIKKKYERQLNLYAKAVEKVFGFTKIDRVIYNIAKGFTIELGSLG